MTDESSPERLSDRQMHELDSALVRIDVEIAGLQATARGILERMITERDLRERGGATVHQFLVRPSSGMPEDAE